MDPEFTHGSAEATAGAAPVPQCWSQGEILQEMGQQLSLIQGQQAAQEERRPPFQDSASLAVARGMAQPRTELCPVPSSAPAEPSTPGWHCGIPAFSYQRASCENVETPSEMIFQCIHKLSGGTFDWMGIYI